MKITREEALLLTKHIGNIPTLTSNSLALHSLTSLQTRLDSYVLSKDDGEFVYASDNKTEIDDGVASVLSDMVREQLVDKLKRLEPETFVTGLEHGGPTKKGWFVTNLEGQVFFKFDDMTMIPVFALCRSGTKLRVREANDGSWRDFMLQTAAVFNPSWERALPTNHYMEL